MALKDDLIKHSGDTFRSVWTERKGTIVPDDNSLKLTNDGIHLDATILYADLSESTNMVDSFSPTFAAEVYKTFLYSSARIIQACGGTIVSYDGDRVMAVYLGNRKNSDAAKTALQINWACKNIIQSELNKIYSNGFVLKHVCGIDTSSIMAAKTGVRGANDIVWVGRAPNHAAKMCSINSEFSSWISADAYARLESASKLSSGTDMWEARTWTQFGNRRIYGSRYWWGL